METKPSILLYRALPPDSKFAEMLDSLMLLLVVLTVAAAAAESPWSAAAAAGVALSLYGSYEIRRRSIERTIKDVRDVIDAQYEITPQKLQSLRNQELPEDIAVVLQGLEGVMSGDTLIHKLEARIARKRLREHLPLVLQNVEYIPPEEPAAQETGT